MVVPPELEEFSGLVESEPQALSSFDDLEDGDGLGWIQTVPTETACRFLQESSPLVVAKRLDVDSSGRRDLTTAHALDPADVHCAPRPIATARDTSPSKTDECASGTLTVSSTKHRTGSGCASSTVSNAKNEQQPDSVSTRRCT